VAHQLLLNAKWNPSVVEPGSIAVTQRMPTNRTLNLCLVGSRLGGTGSLRLSRHHSVKISYSNGTYVRFGGNYQNVSVAWQYSWLGRPN
jgi:hypothetical protein